MTPTNVVCVITEKAFVYVTFEAFCGAKIKRRKTIRCVVVAFLKAAGLISSWR